MSVEILMIYTLFALCAFLALIAVQGHRHKGAADELKNRLLEALEESERLKASLDENSKAAIEKEVVIARLNKDVERLTAELEAHKVEASRLKDEAAKLAEEKISLALENSRRVSELEAQKQKQEELTSAFEEQKKHLKEEISNAMQKLLESKLEKFDETSAKALENLLKPFRENIDGFKKKVEESQKESGERMAALSKEIEQVLKAGMSITAEASNLAKALKGEKQTQGRWGEMVLESVLEHSGLIKNEHYLIQESFKDSNGQHKRPDVIVKLPQERTIIIDSKVSLVDYDKYVKAQTDEERTLFAAAMAKAFRKHVDTLHSKDYAEYDAGTLQYIFMFVPIEAAYAVAVAQDKELYEYALKKQIVIVYPSTLVVTLKTVYLYWQRERSDKTVEAIYNEAGKLYDKVYSFVETFEKIGRQIGLLEDSYKDAAKHLFDGKGNLLKRADNLKTLGAKTSKNLQALKSKNGELFNRGEQEDEDNVALLE